MLDRSNHCFPAVTARLQLAVQNAVKVCPQLAQREVSPHIIRHYLPFLTMSSDIGQRSAEADKTESQRGRTERTTRHSLVDPRGC
jgi:hypothetical protein